MSTGAEWLLKLDAQTKGAADVIAALGKTETAAEQAERMIDRALNSMDRAPKSLKDAFATAQKTAAMEKAQQVEAKRAFKAAQDIKLRTLVASQQLAEVEGQHTKAAESTWKEMFKGELAFHALAKGASLAYEGIKKVGEVLVDAFKEAANEERTQKVFENILGSAADKDEVLDYMDKFAGMSEFTAGALDNLAAEMLRAGLRGADFRNALGASMDVAAQSTDKMAGLAEATRAFRDIQITGKVTDQNLKALRLDPHEVEKQLSKDLGLTPKTIEKKLLEGTLKGTDAMSSIFTVMEKKTGKQLGQVGMEMGDLVGSKLEKVLDLPNEIYKSIKDTAGFQMISDALTDALAAFSPDGPAGKAIKDGLGSLFDSIGETIKEVNWKEVGDQVGRIAANLGEWVDPLSKALRLMLKITEAVSVLPSAGTAIGDWLARKLNPEIDQTSLYDREIADAKEKRQKDFDRMNESAWNDPEVKAIAKQSGIDLAGAQLDGAKQKTETHSPSKVWAKFGRDQAEGLALGMEASGPRIAVATDSMVPVPSLGAMGGATGGFNAGGITIPMTFNVGGSGASADDIAREVSALVPSAILSAFEQLALQGGVS